MRVALLGGHRGSLVDIEISLWNFNSQGAFNLLNFVCADAVEDWSIFGSSVRDGEYSIVQGADNLFAHEEPLGEAETKVAALVLDAVIFAVCFMRFVTLLDDKDCVLLFGADLEDSLFSINQICFHFKDIDISFNGLLLGFG